ncbi:hypothetical protein [Agromyces larvae]|uniref:Uncharacterized protein n=1 Tax=Agromyces larvae TaxID=2929802 RepID=A0ABY4C387_9MICO|nr:hypothetical protein [Agromyces larvae]UOE45907.1 hypothetical protein MTO99_09250 [Agromyces larvae]
MTEGWPAYFRTYRANLDAARPKEIVQEPVRVLEVDDDPSLDGLGRTITGLIKKVEAAGWEWRLRRALVHHPDTLYLADGENHSRGDVKKPAQDVTYWHLRAWWPRARVAFRVSFEERVTPKGGRSFKALDYSALDPVGQPTELYADYSPAGYLTRQEKDEPERAWRQRVSDLQEARRRADLTYNDGADYIDRRPTFASAKDFTTWLNDWLEIAARAAQTKGAIAA